MAGDAKPSPSAGATSDAGEGASPSSRAMPAPAAGAEGDAPSTSRKMSRRANRVAERFGKSDWIELTAAILLAAATIASAWSAYQATRWSGVQANAFSAAGAARTESVRSSNLATAQRQVDVASFIAWLQAYAGEQEGLLDFYQERFREEFKPAFEAWLASVPAGAVPPGTPFALPEYVLAAETAANEQLTVAEEQSAIARQANQTGDNFVIVVVIMASVLFFAGVGTKLKVQRVRQFMIAMSALLFVTGVVVVGSLPQNVGF